jgi:hypothetical protein
MDPLTLVLGIILLGLFGAGVVAGSLGGKSVNIGNNERDRECDSACNQLQARREELCAAKAARERAEQKRNSAAVLFGAALAALIVTAGITFVVATTGVLVPVVGPFVAAALVALGFGLIAGLFAAASFALGNLVGAEWKVSQARDNEEEALNARRDAVSIIRAICSSDDADACIARPTDC